MPEIGATLREARIRSRIDISEVEASTKIRAKYLRALENEEWDLLPGPAYVKSFLRTYAEALGLDAKLLVEEYKLRHERLSETELQPIGRPGAARRRAPSPGRIPRGFVVGVIVVALIGVLYWLGRSGDDKPAGTTQSTTTDATRDGASGAGGSDDDAQQPRRRRRRPSAARRVALRVVPTAPVYVCLVAGSRRLINGVTLQPGAASRLFRSRRFRINLGNGGVTLRFNGRTLEVPDSATGIGYEITRRGRRVLPDGERPDCAPA